jgi:sacsin
LNNATEKVIGVIEKESLALWPTHEGYVTAQSGLLDTGIESGLRDALQEVGAQWFTFHRGFRLELRKFSKIGFYVRGVFANS